jgi:hypothetical protein
MDTKLAAIKDAMNKQSGDGRDIDAARELAEEYVAANPDIFAEYQNLDVADCCKAVDAFRAAGMEDSLWQVETWCLYRFEPQNIGGPTMAQVRIPGSSK